MASDQVVGPRDRDPGVAVLAAAVCGPQGEVVLRIQKPVEMSLSLAGEEVLEAMRSWKASTRRSGWASIASMSSLITTCCTTIAGALSTGYGLLSPLQMLGIWRPIEQRLADMVNQALSVRKKFKRCEISLVQQSQVTYVVQLARYAVDVQIAKSRARNASKEMRETCTICLEDADITKIHAVEGCAHRFCFPCMKEHVKVKLLNGMPQLVQELVAPQS
ncbi:hypothetical protein PR202_ga25032 [Eleusine coracana subsp. coracana]|uniref:Zinc finger C3HC4 RING-type domain-containing protein n=1 Tax=Eleusine coracana subsp. coracana TaxID=191504 RepID=A0AAV5DAC1_ELECO|nr:hypothetical protein PR202_ga25032 [Eleusine coracana subsp. coracana]